MGHQKQQESRVRRHAKQSICVRDFRDRLARGSGKISTGLDKLGVFKMQVGRDPATSFQQTHRRASRKERQNPAKSVALRNNAIYCTTKMKSPAMVNLAIQLGTISQESFVYT